MCGDLRAENAGTPVVLTGWVASTRDHGGVVFIDLRDREGVVQVVAHPEEAPDAHHAASSVKAEWVLRVTGELRKRPAGTVNPNLPTGEVEVAAVDVAVVSTSETPPFPVEDRVEVDEALRLRYR
jgi:aspartyl-tRNA synthetase